MTISRLFGAEQAANAATVAAICAYRPGMLTAAYILHEFTAGSRLDTRRVDAHDADDTRFAGYAFQGRDGPSS